MVLSDLSFVGKIAPFRVAGGRAGEHVYGSYPSLEIFLTSDRTSLARTGTL